MRILLALTLLTMTVSPSYAEGLGKSLEELKAKIYSSDKVCKYIGNKAIIMYRAHLDHRDNAFETLKDKGWEKAVENQDTYRELYYEDFYKNVMLYDSLGCENEYPLAGRLSCASSTKDEAVEVCRIP